MRLFPSMIRCGVAAVAIWWSAIACSDACPLCIALPQQSVADDVINASCVVLARPSTSDPFAYQPIKTLKGSYDGTPIELFINTVTRRTLKTNPQSAMILVQHRQGHWKEAGLSREGFGAVVERILLIEQEWRGDEGRRKRGEFFAPLLGHSNQRIHELAYVELSKAPYSLVRRLSQAVDYERIAPMIARREYAQWRTLAILIAGNRPSAETRSLIRQSVRTSARFHLTRDLAAWATAYIQLDGRDAIEFFEREYIQRRDRSNAELCEIARALALHAHDGRTELRGAITASFRSLVKHYPEVAKQVPFDLQNGSAEAFEPVSR